MLDATAKSDAVQAMLQILEANPNNYFSTDMNTNAPVLKAILEAMVEGIVQMLVQNAVVKTKLTAGGLNSIFAGGVPVPMDGGTALQLAWVAATTAQAKDSAEGSPLAGSGGIS